MITKDEYLQALDIVLEYHEQLNKVVEFKGGNNVYEFLKFLDIHGDRNKKRRVYGSIKMFFNIDTHDVCAIKMNDSKLISISKIDEIFQSKVRNFGEESREELSRVLELFKNQ